MGMRRFLRAPLHSFDGLTPQEARQIQEQLAPRVRTQGAAPRRLRLVAAADCAPRSGDRLGAVVAVLELRSGNVVDLAEASTRVSFPYLPGLLSFREAPVVLEALSRLHTRPDVLLVDGHGLAHPRFFGLACHVGLHLSIPTIGVAKSRLVGKHDLPRARAGSSAPLLLGRRRVGLVLRTRDNVRPVFVSVGHRIGLQPAARVVLRCTRGYRLPEPLRIADRLSRWDVSGLLARKAKGRGPPPWGAAVLTKRW